MGVGKGKFRLKYIRKDRGGRFLKLGVWNIDQFGSHSRTPAENVVNTVETVELMRFHGLTGCDCLSSDCLVFTK